MKKFKVIVNHTGASGTDHYVAGKETVVSEDTVKALGPNAQVVEEIKAEEPKVEEKEVKNPLNKMVGAKDATTK